MSGAIVNTVPLNAKMRSSQNVPHCVCWAPSCRCATNPLPFLGGDRQKIYPRASSDWLSICLIVDPWLWPNHVDHYGVLISQVPQYQDGDAVETILEYKRWSLEVCVLGVQHIKPAWTWSRNLRVFRCWDQKH